MGREAYPGLAACRDGKILRLMQSARASSTPRIPHTLAQGPHAQLDFIWADLCRSCRSGSNLRSTGCHFHLHPPRLACPQRAHLRSLTRVPDVSYSLIRLISTGIHLLSYSSIHFSNDLHDHIPWAGSQSSRDSTHVPLLPRSARSPYQTPLLMLMLCHSSPSAPGLHHSSRRVCSRPFVRGLPSSGPPARPQRHRLCPASVTMIFLQ
jgi:hypothetical protein